MTGRKPFKERSSLTSHGLYPALPRLSTKNLPPVGTAIPASGGAPRRVGPEIIMRALPLPASAATMWHGNELCLLAWPSADNGARHYFSVNTEAIRRRREIFVQ